MIIKIPYDDGLIESEFPSNTEILEIATQKALADNIIKERITGSFNHFRQIHNFQTVLMVVNDSTRRVPNEKIIDCLLECIKPERLEIIIATGTHEKAGSDDLRMILGKYHSLFRGKIYSHDCHENNSQRYLGDTDRGTPVWVNEKVLDAEAIICINSVEPHFFAGFTGGRKSIIPGLAGFETVIKNHSLAKSPDAKSMNLKANPVHLDLLSALNLLDQRKILSIQLLVSRQSEIVSIECGDINESFEKICQVAENYYGVSISHKYDAVFAVGEPPLDINLYQLQKAQEHGAEAVRDGGILIVAGACNEGVGSPYFMQLADDYLHSELALSARAQNDNRFGIHKLMRTARLLQKISIWYITKVDDNLVRRVYFEPKASIGEALRDVNNIFGDACRIAVLKDACYAVPILR